MWVRHGYFFGTVKPENQEKFNAFIDTKARAQWLKFPGLKKLRILREKSHDEGAPGIYQTIELTFESAEAIEKMLASPERAAMGPLMSEIMPLFEGYTKHVNYEVSAEG